MDPRTQSRHVSVMAGRNWTNKASPGRAWRGECMARKVRGTVLRRPRCDFKSSKAGRWESAEQQWLGQSPRSSRRQWGILDEHIVKELRWLDDLILSHRLQCHMAFQIQKQGYLDNSSAKLVKQGLHRKGSVKGMDDPNSERNGREMHEI